MAMAHLIVQGRRIGTLNVFDTVPHLWSEDELQILRLLAGQSATTLQKVSLFEETRRRADEFAALYETSRDLISQQDLAALLATMVERATKLFATPSGTICLYDPARDDLVIAAVKGPELPVGTHIKMGEGAAGIVARTRTPLIVADYSQWEHRLPQYAENQFGAAATVPMLYAGKLIGTLNVLEAAASPRQFTEADLELLDLFAGLAAGAVHNAVLLTETQKRAEQLGTLYDAGLALNSVLDQQAQLKFLLKLATRALSTECSSFFRFDAAHDDMRFEVGIGYSAETEKGLHALVFAGRRREWTGRLGCP